MFVAQGMIGRTILSCDDGHTWVADRAWDVEGDPLLCGSTTPVSCYEGSCMYLSGGTCETSSPCDCGHHPGFSKGVVFGDGWFVGTWGWGHSGSVRRSRDGVTWEETLDEDVYFGGIAHGAGRFVLSSRSPMYSTDGSAWMAGSEADFQGPSDGTIWSVRRFMYADHAEGRFVAVASGSADWDMLVSSDGGETWWRPTTLPGDCVENLSPYGGMAYGNGAIVIVSSDGTVCRSTDGGDTWATSAIADAGHLNSHVVFTGEEHVVWGDGVRFTSADGTSWTRTDTSPSGLRIGAVARSDTGSYVAVGGYWPEQSYDNQAFFRSDDGVTWERLPASAFTGGHPIFSIAFGYGEPSAVCPLP
jgi:hypothetical protein